MFYTVYKITNRVNQKTYIGMHKTSIINDDYMGSGELIKNAIKKYGIDNFIKDVLFIYDNKEDMKNKEIELVNDEYLNSGMTYNLCYGGHGGSRRKGVILTEELKTKISKSVKIAMNNPTLKAHLSKKRLGKKASMKTRQKSSKSHKTLRWISDIENQKSIFVHFHEAEKLISTGKWIQGRKYGFDPRHGKDS